jgi:hypothetical protein
MVERMRSQSPAALFVQFVSWARGTCSPRLPAGSILLPPEVMVEHYRDHQGASHATGGSNRGGGESTKKVRSAARQRPSNQAKTGHTLADDTINASMLGEHLDPAGNRTAHSACYTPLGNGEACHSELYRKKRYLQKHLRTFMDYSQEVRTETVFQLLVDRYYADLDAAGLPVGPPRWHYYVHTPEGGVRDVCQHVFLLSYPLSKKTLERLQKRIIDGCTMAHAKKQEGGVAACTGSVTSNLAMKSLSVIGWYQAYAVQMGDYMPDDDQLIVPRRSRCEEYDEYAAALGDEAAGYKHYCDTIRTAPELAFICRARKLLNFQHCKTCVNLNEKVKQAIASKNADEIKRAKATRAAHHQSTRAERYDN